jgi:hypothetical protein
MVRSGLFRLDLESGEVSTVFERVFNEYELLPQPGVIVYSVRASRRGHRRDLVRGQETVIHRVPAPSTLVEMALSNRGDRLRLLVAATRWNGRWAAARDRSRLAATCDGAPASRRGRIHRRLRWSPDDRDIIIKRAKSDGANPSPTRGISPTRAVVGVDAMTRSGEADWLELRRSQPVRLRPDGRGCRSMAAGRFKKCGRSSHVLSAP